MKAVVMAGGEGTRLRPLTSNQPKPMVPIVGKPCIEHIVELLKRHGFEDVIVTVAFLPQAIRSYFGSGETLGIDIEVNVVGKAATWILYAAVGFRIVTHDSTEWPLVLFSIGVGLAVAAAGLYAVRAWKELHR